MNILAFDTTFDHCSVALVCHDEQVLFDVEPLQQGHAEALVPKIQTLLQRAGYAFQDIDLIAVGSGPGSFTGIRVAIATARGLALASNIPVVGINSFEIFHTLAVPQINERERLYVVLDARRRDLFYQVYDWQKKPIAEPQVAMPCDRLPQIASQSYRVIGTGSQRLQQELHACEGAARNCVFLEHSWEEFLKVLANKARIVIANDPNSASCQPYYLAPPGITPSNKA